MREVYINIYALLSVLPTDMKLHILISFFQIICKYEESASYIHFLNMSINAVHIIKNKKHEIKKNLGFMKHNH